MAATIKFESAAFTTALRNLHKKLKVDGERLMRNEAGLALRRVMGDTPPYSTGAKGNPTGGLSKKAKERGENAVKRDISFVIGARSTGYLQMIADTFGTAHVNQALRRKKDGKLYVVDMDYITFSKREVAAFHKRKRSKRRGNIPFATSKRQSKDIGRHTAREKMYTTNAIRTQYIKEKMAKVGLAKSGWNSALRALKRPIPLWVKRHGYSHSGYLETGKGTNKFMITATNNLVYIPNYRRIVDRALMLQGKAMDGKLRRVLKDGIDTYKFKKGI